MIYNLDCIAGARQHMADESLDLLVCDPPYYNLAFCGTKHTKTKKPRFNVFANDKLSAVEYQRFSLDWLNEAYRTLKTGRHIYVFIDWRIYPHMALWMQHVGFTLKSCIVWDKVHMGMGWQYRFQHEFIVFAVKGKHKVRRISTRTATDIWRIPKISGNKTVHPTEKPVELMERIIRNSSEEGETVGDFFLGSGPVVEAAVRNGRGIVGFEMDEGYLEIARQRIESTKREIEHRNHK